MSIIKNISRFETCFSIEKIGKGKRISLLLSFFVLLFSSCQKQEKEKEISSEKTTDNRETSSEFKSSKIKDNPTLFENICAVSPMEFTDLYPRVRTISDDAHEKIILLDSLKLLGFEVRETGRGNFKKGPRFMMFILYKDSCKIRVDKLYYSTDTIGTFRVTERVKKID